MTGDTWFRYIDTEYWEEGCSEPERHIVLVSLKVIKETPRTVVLVREPHVYPDGSIPDWAERKRVLKNARRRWAYPTKALALDSYRQRKRSQISHMQHALNRALACRAAIAVVEGLLA